jgi:translation elongation factor EF-4
MDLLVADEPVAAFCRIVSRRRLEEEAKTSVEKLHKILPRQMFTLKIQAKARPHHRFGNSDRNAKKCHPAHVRRRQNTQNETLGKAKRRKEENEGTWKRECEYSPGRLY